MFKYSKILGTFTTVLSCILLAGNVVASTKTESIASDTGIIDGGVDLNTQPNEAPKYSERAPRPRQKELPIKFQTQINDYYCGPASASMIVTSLGRPRSQQQMATLLGTTANGTNAGNNVSNALNTVMKGSRYKFNWVWHKYSDINTIKDHITHAISYGNPVMVNTMESPGDCYLAGHNIGTTLYHYGIVADYFDYGNTVTYVDPGYGRYNGFRMNQRVSIKDMSYATGGRGYAW